MVIYKLEIEIIGDDWDDVEYYFFKTPEERENFKEQYERENVDKTGRHKYIPTISSIHYYFEDNDFDNLKDIITISQYEELFNTEINPIVY